MFFIINIFLFQIFFSQINSSLFNLTQIRIPTNSSIIDDLILKLITTVMNSAKSLEYLPGVSGECNRKLDRSFFIIDKTIYRREEKILAYYYYTKLLLDSSTNVNDLSSYPNCLNSDHEYDFSNADKNSKPMDPLYVTIFIDHRKEQLEFFRNNDQTTSYLVGICFIEGCTDNDIKLLAENVLNLLKITKMNETLEIFTLNDQHYQVDFWNLFLKFIPVNIILLHIFIVFFHSFIAFLFKLIKSLLCSCRKNQNRTIKIKFGDDEEFSNDSINRTLTNQTKKQKQNQKLKNYLNALFNVENNFNFLLNSESKDEIHSDTGLSYMNGIKGISLVTTIFGFVFIDFYNTPIIKKSLDNFYVISSHPLFFIFYFGIKYAPKLLLCSSGFSLFYKFMCFLDDKTDVVREITKVNLEQSKYEQSKEAKKLENNNINKTSENISDKKGTGNEKGKDNKSADNIKPKNIRNNSIKSEGKEKSKEYGRYSSYSSSSEGSSTIKRRRNTKKNIPFKYYIWFLTSQINKYILYLLLILFVLFSLYDIGVFFVGIGPLWTFFKMKMVNTSTKLRSLIPAILCYQGTFFNKFDVDSLFTYLYLVYQEVIFFIVSTFIIFIGFKYNLRIDRFILVEISLLFVFRVFYYYLADDINNREYFDLNSYGYFYNSPIYNYLYYSLGIYFGSLNYVIQKGYTYYECERQKKMYLLGFTRLLKILTKRSKLLFHFLGILFLILIILFSFSQFFLFEYVKLINDLSDKDIQQYPNILNAFNDDILTSIIMMFDTDIVVLLVNLMALFFYLKGENLVNDFLNLDFFAIFNKIYFTFIILINPVIFYVFYMTESRINFNMQNCFLYSFACGILVFIISTFTYGIFELPYKKLFRLILKNTEIEVGEKRMDLIEKQVYNFKKGDDKDDSGNNSEDSYENLDKPLFDVDEY
jgi:hypothetical protein